MHEYVSQPGKPTTYWSCRNCGERRNLERVQISQDSSYHACTIQKGKVVHEANLIDISPAGARFRLIERTNIIALHLDDQVLFNPQLTALRELATQLPGVIRWFKRRDYGVKFDTPLTLSSDELRRILDR